MSKNKRKKIVVIGGGTGVFTVLSGLRKYPYDLSAIVSMFDDGGSTGILREEFGILPPGDIRRALVALSDKPQVLLSKLFNYRFSEGRGLYGHTFGNILITALERLTGNFLKAINEAGKILSIKGKVIPVTLKKAKLIVFLENGQKIIGETNIDIPKHNANLKIVEAKLEPKCSPTKEALKAIKEADLIIIGPGDLYTSIIPNLLVLKISKAIQKSKAKKIYVCNLMTKFGETNNFKASDFLNVIEKYLAENVLDYFIVNTKKPDKKRLKKYSKEKSSFVYFDEENLENKKITILTGDFLRSRGFLRHDSNKLAKAINLLIKRSKI